MSNQHIQIKALGEQGAQYLKEIMRNVPKGTDEQTVAAMLVLSRLSGHDSQTFKPIASEAPHVPEFRDAEQARRMIAPLVKALRMERSKNTAITHGIERMLHEKWGDPISKKTVMRNIADEIEAHCAEAGIVLFPQAAQTAGAAR